MSSYFSFRPDTKPARARRARSAAAFRFGRLRELKQCELQLRREKGRQRAAFRGLDPDDLHTGRCRPILRLVQQNRLPDASQTDQKHALCGVPDPDPLGRDPNFF